MSTFSGLTTAYSGLTAARQGLDVVGQNIANATTTGYTRQRVATAEVGALPGNGPLFAGRVQVGQGVSVESISRLGDVYLDARVRTAAATSGNLAVQSNALSGIEASLHEPGASGISSQLQGYWAAWQDVANHPGEPAPAGVLLVQAKQLTGMVAAGYTAVDNAWDETRNKLSGMVAELNDAGARVADLNGRIRSTLAAGGSANELLDQRNSLTTTIAALTGGTVRTLADGTADVLIGGNALVTGDTFRAVTVVGSTLMSGAAPVALEWASRPGVTVAVESGEIAGSISLLAPPNGAGTGGAIAEAAAGYNAFATSLAAQINAVHRVGSTTTGVTGLDFFSVAAVGPPALGLGVIPTSAAGLATGTPGAGALDGSNADAIGAIGGVAGSPDSAWSAFVTTIGVAAKSLTQQATLAQSASTSASKSQLANSSVDLDEESLNMVTFQKAYQGAARVMTAVDEMLDVLINRTGLVGR